MVSKEFSLELFNIDDMSPLESLRNILVSYKGIAGKPLSLADVSKITRVEPITIISNDLSGVKELYNILHGVLNIYTSYYLQAISILSADLVDVKILKILDKVNPDRDLKTFLTARTNFESRAVNTLSLRNSKYKLPFISTESLDEEVNELNTTIDKLDTFEKLGVAIGKIIDVKFTIRSDDSKDKQVLSMPIVVRLDTGILDNTVINSILTLNNTEITFTSRLKDVFAGRISFIKDFILASDLIKNHKKAMFKDSSGTYNTILKRINNSRLYSALTGNISLGAISSIFVLSENNESEIVRKFGSGLTSPKIRNMIFDNISAMMIVVVDREWERVSIYVRDIDGYSQNSFEDFKPMADKNTNAIVDIFKAFTLGNAPSF